MRKRSFAPLILFILFAALSWIFLFNYPAVTGLLWPGLLFGIIACTILLRAIVLFLRKRSVTSGVVISTSILTGLYFLASRSLSVYSPYIQASTGVAMAESVSVGFAALTPLILAQIGLFVIWLALIVFIIYIHIRPIKKIDLLLSQILDSQEIKNLKIGKSRQYKNIETKLRILANEKYKEEQKRQARIKKCQENKSRNNNPKT